MNMSSRATFALASVWLFFAQAPVSFAQAPRDGAEPSASKDRQVDALFSRVNTSASPGCAVAVMLDGAIVYVRGYGMADLNHGIANSPESVFHVASVSKQFTAAAIQLLASEGRLSLDDPVQKFIPELHDFGVAVTLRQLLHHTSGIRDQWDLLGLAGWRYSRDLITDDDVMRVLARQKGLNFPPDTRFLYSNSGYTLLAQVVKRVSGMSFREFTTERIFKPLGMKHSHFRDDHAEIVPNIAYGYVRAGDTFRLSVTNFDTVGATSLLTTVEDLALWDENFYQPRVLNAELLQEMATPGRLPDGTALDYGLGLTVGTYRGLPVVSHSGADAGYRSELLRFPRQHFSVSCLCNLAEMDPSRLAQQVADIYLASELEAVPETPAVKPARQLTDGEAAQWIGTYIARDDGMSVRIGLENGVLRVTSVQGSLTLQPIDGRRAVAAEFPVQFELVDQAGTAKRGLRIVPPGGAPITAEWTPPYTPTSAQLAQYAGVYFSDEIEARWMLTVENGQLMLSSIRMQPRPLNGTGADVFESPRGSLRFVRKNGEIEGFDVSTGRIVKLRFTKIGQ